METGDPFLRRGSMTFLTGSNVPKKRTRAKMEIVASDRARRENVPRHILFYVPAYFFIQI